MESALPTDELEAPASVEGALTDAERAALDELVEALSFARSAPHGPTAIARRLGIPPAIVQYHVAKALAKLRARISRANQTW